MISASSLWFLIYDESCVYNMYNLYILKIKSSQLSRWQINPIKHKHIRKQMAQNVFVRSQAINHVEDFNLLDYTKSNEQWAVHCVYMWMNIWLCLYNQLTPRLPAALDRPMSPFSRTLDCIYRAIIYRQWTCQRTNIMRIHRIIWFSEIEQQL